MNSRKSLIVFMAVVCIVQLTTASLPVSGSSISAQVEYYASHTEDLSLLTSIDFQPTDVAIKTLDGNLNHNRTSSEHGWIGALSLNKGYATDNFSSYRDFKIPISISYSVDELSVDQAYLKIDMQSIFHLGWSAIKGSHPLFEGNVTQGSKGSITDNMTMFFSADNLDNGSYLLNQGYYSILSNENNTYYSTLSAQFTTLNNQSWNYTASVSINLHTIDNPEFFALMLSRLNRTEAAPSSPVVTKYVTANPEIGYLIFAGIFIVVALFFYFIYRRLK